MTNKVSFIVVDELGIGDLKEEKSPILTVRVFAHSQAPGEGSCRGWERGKSPPHQADPSLEEQKNTKKGS